MNTRWLTKLFEDTFVRALHKGEVPGTQEAHRLALQVVNDEGYKRAMRDAIAIVKQDVTGFADGAMDTGRTAALTKLETLQRILSGEAAPQESPPRHWMYAESEDAEHWGVATDNTREGAIADGTNEYEGRPFVICRGSEADVGWGFRSALSIDQIVESALECLTDEYGGDYEDWNFDDTKLKLLESDLHAVATRWAQANRPPRKWFVADGKIENIEIIERTS